jgi:hypothetical protein
MIPKINQQVTTTDVPFEGEYIHLELASIFKTPDVVSEQITIAPHLSFISREIPLL